MSSNKYEVENKWGDPGTWHPGGTYVIGNRQDQNQYVVALNVTSNDGGKTLEGTMTYSGEEPIGFRGTLTKSNKYEVENKWGDPGTWHPGGTYVIGNRQDQNQYVVALNVTSNDGGKTLEGTMTYSGEEAIGFRGKREA